MIIGLVKMANGVLLNGTYSQVEHKRMATSLVKMANGFFS